MPEIKKRKNTGQITLLDVAKFAGVGMMTVSRALRTPEQVSDKLKQRIDHAINTLGYKPNTTASQLASANSNNLIIIVVPQLYDDGLRCLLNTLQKQLIVGGYTTLLIESYCYKDREKSLLESIYSHNSAAIILFYLEKNNPLQQTMLCRNIPIININTEGNGTHIEAIDNMRAMYTLTNYIIKKGYRNIGLLCANHEYSLFQQRLHGWHKAMLDNHLPTHRVINAAKPANFTTGSELLADFILNWPELDALVCTTDELACGVLYECQRRHIKIPYQLAVAGFGDSEFAQVSIPPLTTISIPYQQIAEYIAETLLHQIKTKSTLILPDFLSLKPVIKVRASL